MDGRVDREGAKRRGFLAEGAGKAVFLNVAYRQATQCRQEADA